MLDVQSGYVKRALYVYAGLQSRQLRIRARVGNSCMQSRTTEASSPFASLLGLAAMNIHVRQPTRPH